MDRRAALSRACCYSWAAVRSGARHWLQLNFASEPAPLADFSTRTHCSLVRVGDFARGLIR